MLALPGFNQRVLAFEATSKAADKLITNGLDDPTVVFALHRPAFVTNIKSPLLQDRNRLV